MPIIWMSGVRQFVVRAQLVSDEEGGNHHPRRHSFMCGGSHCSSLGTTSTKNRANFSNLHQIYVWQRAWTPAVREAMQNTGDKISLLVVLTAEVSFRSGSPRVVQIPLDYELFRKSPQPVGLALRIRTLPRSIFARQQRYRICRRAGGEVGERGSRSRSGAGRTSD